MSTPALTIETIRRAHQLSMREDGTKLRYLLTKHGYHPDLYGLVRLYEDAIPMLLNAIGQQPSTNNQPPGTD